MRKSTLFVAFMTTFLFSFAAKADTDVSIEPEVAITKEGSDPQIANALSRTFPKSPFGVYGYWRMREGWVEGYAGPTYSPRPWLTIGTGAGVEQTFGYANPQGRYNITFAMRAEEMFSSAEIGGSFEMNTATLRHGDMSGMWYDVYATVTIAQTITWGARGRRFLGFGPLLQWNVHEMHTKIWGMLGVVDPEQYRDPFTFTGLTGLTFDL